MSNTVWMNQPGLEEDYLSVGDVRFVVMQQGERIMRDRPARANDGKGTLVLFGECVVDAYRATAEGLGRVIKVLPNRRVKVEMLTPEEYPDGLEGMGFPDLAYTQPIGGVKL